MISFTVRGKAAPAGSKNAFPRRDKFGQLTGGVIVADASKYGKEWRLIVQSAAKLEMRNGVRKFEGPVSLWLDFELKRPKDHYFKSGELKGSAPAFPTKKPDLTKLIRAVEDALTGICWADDVQVVRQHASKVYGEKDILFVYINEIKP